MSSFILSNRFTDFAPEGTHIKLRFNCDTKEELLIDLNSSSTKTFVITANGNYVFQGQDIAPHVLISWLLFMALINLYILFISSSRKESVGTSSVCGKSTGSVESVLECFSIQSNVSRLNDEDLNDDFKFIYGFRMVFLIGSTIFHVFFLPIFWSPIAVINILNFSREGHTWLNQEFGSNMSAGMPLAFVMA